MRLRLYLEASFSPDTASRSPKTMKAPRSASSLTVAAPMPLAPPCYVSDLTLRSSFRK